MYKKTLDKSNNFYYETLNKRILDQSILLK